MPRAPVNDDFLRLRSGLYDAVTFYISALHDDILPPRALRCYFNCVVFRTNVIITLYPRHSDDILCFIFQNGFINKDYDLMNLALRYGLNVRNIVRIYDRSSKSCATSFRQKIKKAVDHIEQDKPEIMQSSLYNLLKKIDNELK
jgi:hypothetical protein